MFPCFLYRIGLKRRRSPWTLQPRKGLIDLDRPKRTVPRLGDEDGQSLVLAIGLCAITLLTISVVLAASAVNLKARQLLSLDRKSTRLNSSHVKISYAVFCLKKKRI